MTSAMVRAENLIIAVSFYGKWTYCLYNLNENMDTHNKMVNFTQLNAHTIPR